MSTSDAGVDGAGSGEVVSSALAVEKRQLAAKAREGTRRNWRRKTDGEDSHASASPVGSRRSAAVRSGVVRRRGRWREVEPKTVVLVLVLVLVFGRTGEGKYLRSEMVCV